jgi:hypothetical protein
MGGREGQRRGQDIERVRERERERERERVRARGLGWRSER